MSVSYYLKPEMVVMVLLLEEERKTNQKVDLEVEKAVRVETSQLLVTTTWIHFLI
jgi:hypothetical protein